MDNRFIAAALMGTAIERKTTIMSTKLRPMTMARKSGSREAIRSPRSPKVAVMPPT